MSSSCHCLASSEPLAGQAQFPGPTSSAINPREAPDHCQRQEPSQKLHSVPQPSLDAPALLSPFITHALLGPEDRIWPGQVPSVPSWLLTLSQEPPMVRAQHSRHLLPSWDCKHHIVHKGPQHWRMLRTSKKGQCHPVGLGRAKSRGLGWAEVRTGLVGQVSRSPKADLRYL